MRSDGRRALRRFVFLCAFAAATFALCPGAALAEDGLSISAELTAGTFAGTLRGERSTLHASVAGGGTEFGGFSITDTRGTGVGRYVTLVATRFENATFAGKDLALGSLTMPKLTVVKANEQSSDVPGDLHAAAAIDTGGDGVVMAACSEHGQGMGTYDFSAANGEPWKLAITADEHAGAYYSTVTTTVATLAL
jgi:hypothetical protein